MRYAVFNIHNGKQITEYGTENWSHSVARILNADKTADIYEVRNDA